MQVNEMCHSLWQQSGRAGRREKPSLSVYVAFGGPLDQHFMKSPHKLFMKPIENAQVDASNQQVNKLLHIYSRSLHLSPELSYLHVRKS